MTPPEDSAAPWPETAYDMALSLDPNVPITTAADALERWGQQQREAGRRELEPLLMQLDSLMGLALKHGRTPQSVEESPAPESLEAQARYDLRHGWRDALIATLTEPQNDAQ